MEQTWTKLMIVTVVLLLTHSKASGQSCTNGFLNRLSEAITPQPVPLLRMDERTSPEQWIFPEMQFTCRGRLTTWIFRGIPGLNVADSCRVHLTTWRLDSFNTFVNRYVRVSTTERNMARITEDESFFTYVLATPVQVEPGDIVGAEMGFSCRPSQPFDNIQSLNISGSGQTFTSYWRTSALTSLVLDSSTTVMEQDYIPLIQVIFGSPAATTIPQGDTSSEVGNDQLGGTPSTVAIAAGIVGGFVGLVALVAVCICVGWLARHVQVHVHYAGKKGPRADQRDERRGGTANSSEMLVQANTAYRQVPSNRQPIQTTNGIVLAEQGMCLNQPQRGSGSRGETREREREGQGMMALSNNIAYHQVNQTQTEVNSLTRHTNFAVPMPYELPTPRQPRLLEDDEDHPYEYIL